MAVMVFKCTMIGRRGHERVGSCASLGRVSRHPGPVPSRPRYGVLEDYSREAPITRARHMAVSRPVDVHGGGMSVDRDHYSGRELAHLPAAWVAFRHKAQTGAFRPRAPRKRIMFPWLPLSGPPAGTADRGFHTEDSFGSPRTPRRPGSGGPHRRVAAEGE